MKRVFIATPFAAPTHEGIARHVRYARACVADSLRRGEAPFAGHIHYTQPGVLRDEVEEERRLGIDAGLVWMRQCEALCVYRDLGVSSGMVEEVRHAAEVLGIPTEYRELGKGWDASLPSGTYPDEATVVRDKEGRIDELIASSVYFHMKRMGDGWFWFALSDQDFSVSLEAGVAVVEHNGDSGCLWRHDDPDVDQEHVPIENSRSSHVYLVRPCPNPGCEDPEDIKLERPATAVWVRCRSCGMTGPQHDNDSESAVRAWNDLPRRLHWSHRKESE